MNRRNLLKLAIGGAAAVVAAPAAAFNVPAKLSYWYAAGLMFTRRGKWLIAVRRELGPYWERQVVCKHVDDRSFVFTIKFAGDEIWDDRDRLIGYIADMADSSYRNYTGTLDGRDGTLLPPKFMRPLRGYHVAPEIG